MSNMWGLGERAIPHQANWQVRGVNNADQQAIEDSGTPIESLWYGPKQQEPYRANGSVSEMLTVMDRLQRYLPNMAAMRMPFNINNWGSYGTPYASSNMLASTEAFYQAAKQQGMKFHFVLMDGPSQRESGELPRPTSRDRQEWLSFCDRLSARQVLSHRMLVEWMTANPEKAPEPWAFEFINEPDTYAAINNVLGNGEGYAIYAQHNVEIYKQVYKDGPFQSAWMFMGGFNYSANFGPLASPNAALGGISPIQYVRNNIPVSRLCWSMHAYPGWVGSATQTGFRQNLRNRMGGLTPKGIEGDRICITEMNVQHDTVLRYPFVQDALAMVNYIRNLQWLAEKEISLGWWTMGNYAQGRLVQIISGMSGVRIEETWCYCVFFAMAAYRNNPLYFTSAQNGLKGLDHDLSIQRAQLPEGGDERTELLAHGVIGKNGEMIGVNRVGLGFGGRGTCVVQGNPGTVNVLIGGDGWNVLYGPESGESYNFFALGRGGGVVRDYVSDRVAMLGSSHTPSRMFLGTGKTSVILQEGATNHTIISVDTSSTYHSTIFGFNERRDSDGNGDRLHFRGAFATLVDLKNATKPERPAFQGNLTDSLREDMVITFPSGGSLRICNNYGVFDVLDTVVLDFNGWTAPADYNEADLSKPAPDPQDMEFASLTYDEEAGGGGDEGGGDQGDVIARDTKNNVITFRNDRGDSIPLVKT